MKQIGFLGLGIMGSRMSKRLLDAGFEITVWNRTPGKAQDLVRAGAKEAKTPKEASSNKDAVLTMLADPHSVLQTVLGQNGIIEGLSKGSLLIDFTTVDPATPQKINDALKTKGVRFLESPVTGSKPAAESGELVLMVGGDPQVLEEANPILKPLSKKIVHMGPVSSGARMKLVNNLIIAGSMQALFEGLTLGKKGGLNHEAMLEVLTSSALSSFLLKMKGIAVMDRDFNPNFSVKHMAKDIHLAMEEAHHQCLSLSQLATNHALYEAAMAQVGNEDFSALIKVTEKVSGTEN
ncbi:MAG TPA: NAD(P)-dependent oxidoreductase [Nitrospiria bacterium]|jgi:3-hydroxyisobutyrate dehydrogenase-like beta-hydroxyacid dehydrogenase